MLKNKRTQFRQQRNPASEVVVELFIEPTAYFAGQSRRGAARTDGNDEVVATDHSGYEEIAGLWIGGGIDPEAARSGVGDDAGVHVRRGGGEDKGGAVEVSGGIGFGAPIEGGMGFVGGT
jgi:hypothetical protein